MFQQVIENWLRANYQYEVRTSSPTATLPPQRHTTISINHMDKVGLEIFYEDGRLAVVWDSNTMAGPGHPVGAAQRILGFSTSYIYYSDPDMLDKLRTIISNIEENHAILIS